MKLFLCLILLSSYVFAGIDKRDLALVKDVKQIWFETLNDWNSGFYVGEKMGSPKVSMDTLKTTYAKSSNPFEFYKDLKKFNLNRNYEKKNGYKILIDKLFALKKHIRLDKGKKNNYISYLKFVNTLGEEALYIMYLKFKGEIHSISYGRNIYPGRAEINQTCKKDLKNRFANLRNIKICQGDIFVSKGKKGSSSFIAGMTNAAVNYSHSTIAYVPPKKNAKLYMVESFTEDGVKLRDASKYYGKVDVVKFSVFRYHTKEKTTLFNDRLTTINAVDNFVEVMKQKVSHLGDSTMSPLKKIQKYSSFPYDFEMNTGDSTKLYCSEIPYVIYELYNQDSPFIPYPERKFSDFIPELSKISKYLGVDFPGKMPAPADIEKNSNYDTVAMFYNLKALQKNRITEAMIDVLYKLVEESKAPSDHVVRILKKFSALEGKELLALASQIGVLTPKQVKKFNKQIPEGISANQLLFFGVLDMVISPKVQKELKDIEDQYIKNLGKPLNLLDLRIAAKTVLESALKELDQKINN